VYVVQYIELSEVKTERLLCLPVGSFLFTPWEEGGTILTMMHDNSVIYIDQAYEYIVGSIATSDNRIIRLPDLDEDDDENDGPLVSLVDGEWDDEGNLVGMKFSRLED
jgi:hypothetical protein